MALIVLASASGSPGVTTTALAFTLNWHRPALLVEAAPDGASGVFAGYFRGAQEPTGGLINLALAQRDGTLVEALPRETLILDPDAPAEKSAGFLPGIRSHEQAPSMLPLWEPLAEQLRALDRNGQDVTVGGLSRLGALLVDEDGRWPTVPAVVPRVRPYTARQIAKALQIPVVASVDWDPEVAEVYSHGARKPRKFESSGLLRSYRACAASIHSILATNQAALAPTIGGRA